MEKIPYSHESRMNFNKIKVSCWYPSNLIEPVKVNKNIFKRDKFELNKYEKEEQEKIMKKRQEKINKLNNETENIKNDPVKKLSAENDDMSYIPRLFPLYRSHFSNNIY